MLSKWNDSRPLDAVALDINNFRNRINVFRPFEPVCCLNVPVVEENFEAGGKLKQNRGDLTFIKTRSRIKRTNINLDSCNGSVN